VRGHLRLLRGPTLLPGGLDRLHIRSGRNGGPPDGARGASTRLRPREQLPCSVTPPWLWRARGGGAGRRRAHAAHTLQHRRCEGERDAARHMWHSHLTPSAQGARAWCCTTQGSAAHGGCSTQQRRRRRCVVNGCKHVLCERGLTRTCPARRLLRVVQRHRAGVRAAASLRDVRASRVVHGVARGSACSSSARLRPPSLRALHPARARRHRVARSDVARRARRAARTLVRRRARGLHGLLLGRGVRRLRCRWRRRSPLGNLPQAVPAC